MQIETINAKTQHYPNLGRYFFADLRCGKHHASFAVGPNGVDVCVHNAANRAWKGLGKRFTSLEVARANYKTAAIVAMIDHTAALNAAEFSASAWRESLAVFQNIITEGAAAGWSPAEIEMAAQEVARINTLLTNAGAK